MSGNEPRQAPADFDDWREPLLKSLRDCGVQRAPRLAFLRYPLVFLAYAVTITVGGVGGRIMSEAFRRAPPPVAFIAYGLFFVFVVAVLSRIRNYFLRSAWQSSARSAEDEIARIGSRRPVLYLRSFGLDQKIGRRSWLERYLGTRPFPNAEMLMTTELKKLGPVIAIGRPGEKLPALGAARFYVTDDRWQEKVIDILKCAQLVIWATGVTEGLRWEITHLAENIHPRRFILWAHPHLLGVSAEKREAEWTRFRETLGSVFPKPLPEKLGDARFFVFDAEWTPRAVPAPLTAVFTSPQTSALRDALRLQQNGFDDPTANRPRILDPSQSSTDFGALVGARGPQINWRLVGAFAVALFLSSLLNSVVMRMIIRFSGDVPIGPIVSASRLMFLAAETAAVVLAFRFLRSSTLAVLAAAAGVTLYEALFGSGRWAGDEPSTMVVALVRFVIPFLEHAAFFGGLTWAVARCSPLFVALWFGFFLSDIVSLGLDWQSYFLTDYASDSSFGFLMESISHIFERMVVEFPGWLGPRILRAAIFAGIYVAAIKLLPLVQEAKPAPKPASEAA